MERLMDRSIREREYRNKVRKEQQMAELVKSINSYKTIIMIFIIVTLSVALGVSNYIMAKEKNYYTNVISSKDYSIKELGNTIVEKDLAISELRTKNAEDIKALTTKLDSAQSLSKDLKTKVKSLDNQITELKSENAKMKAKLDKQTFMEKYSYAFTYGGRSTDLTYEQAKLGETLMEEKGYNPNLLFGILMTESGGDSDADNPASTALGYGQFLKGTGKFVYEDLLDNGRGTYNHNYLKNGETSIKMMVAYIDYLVTRRSGSVYKAIKSYSGRDDTSVKPYINKINSFIKCNGASIYDM